MPTVRLLVCALLLTLATAALGGDHPSHRNVVIVGDDGEKATVTLDGSRLTVTAQDGDDVSVKEIDLAEVAHLVGDALDDALAGLGVALDELGDTDVDVRVDADHRVVVRSGDETTTIDLAEVMASVSGALADLEIVIADDAATAGEASADAAEEAQLQAEIATLRAEIAKLQADLGAR